MLDPNQVFLAPDRRLRVESGARHVCCSLKGKLAGREAAFDMNSERNHL
jgi:hypothetical protein